jgi:hypothetical protein
MLHHQVANDGERLTWKTTVNILNKQSHAANLGVTQKWYLEAHWMNLAESDCDGERWIKLAQDHVQWPDFILMMSNLYGS